jgi:hypothetical protein
VAVVQRVDEVQAEVAGNQIEARRTPARDFRDFFGLGQRSLPFQPVAY